MSREQIEEMAKDHFVKVGKMEKEKQIKEMAGIIDKCYPNAKITNDFLAKMLYNAGYRKQAWISVDDRSPDKWQRCLCYYPEKDYGSKVVVDYAETDNGGFAEQFQFGKPSHWMPLPEAPKMKG